jgi:hypothetical protein
MATTMNLTPEQKLGVLNVIAGNIGNPEAIRQAAQRFGATANDLANITGIPVDQVHQYFLDAGVPMGTVLTGDVQRNFGTEGNIRQLDKGEDITVEKAIGRQGDKIVVQRYDAYGTPTTTRLADPNTSEGRGWLQALGVVSGAIGLSSLPEISSLFGGTEATTAAGSTAAPVGGTVAGGTTASTVPASSSGLLSSAVPGGAATGTLEAAGAAANKVIPFAAGMDAGSIAYADVLMKTGSAELATLASEVASGNAAAGLSLTDSVLAGTTAAADAAATGAVTSTGNVVGGGGNITTGATIRTGATVGSNLLSDAANAIKPASDAAKALLDPKTLGSLVNSGVNLSLIQDAADKLRKQGQISQDDYNALSTRLFNTYRDVGLGAGTALANIGERASKMVGDFTPYGVSTNLVNTRVNPQTGQLESNITDTAQMLMAPLGRAAIQSAQAAEMTNVDQLSKDYYNKLAALSAPEAQRQRLATEERMRQQGRLGLLGSGLDVAGKQVSTAAPELTALEQALARQQLEREVQSRNLALGERGTLLSQAQQAYAPLQQISQQALQQAQLSGQLGQLSQAGRIAQTSAYMQPAMTGITAPLSLFAQGLPQVAGTQRLGIASNLAAQQAALDAQAVGRTNVANQLLGQNGANIGSLINKAAGLFNQSSGRELYDLFNVGGLSPDTLAALQQTGNAGLQDIIGNTGNLLSIGLGG